MKECENARRPQEHPKCFRGVGVGAEETMQDGFAMSRFRCWPFGARAKNLHMQSTGDDHF